MRTEHILLIGAGVLGIGVGAYFLLRKPESARMPVPMPPAPAAPPPPAATPPKEKKMVKALKYAQAAAPLVKELVPAVVELFKPGTPTAETGIPGAVFKLEGNLFEGRSPLF